MTSRSDLRDYEERRDFERTPEPAPGRGRRSQPGRRFVVQQHRARNLHFDLRLEVGGVLRSWALPKGLATDPRERRLAMPTEDHPLEYADFEGVIPADEYGAGAVIVWDAGEYENLSGGDGEEVTIDRALADGHAAVWLEGRKLRGGYTLQRIGGGDRERWLVIKRRDEAADARRNPARTEPRSVLSGRTVDEVAREGE